MTDPLTGKQLLEKSFEYIDRLTRECTKFILEEHSKSHRKLSLDNVASIVGSDIVRWFEKRDKNITLASEANTVTKPQSNQYHMKFSGETKDVEFELSCVAVTFVVPGSEFSGSSICFLKSLSLTADKTKFTRRKPDH